ncbi:MAG: hypothetical protein KH282_09570 [Clostridiales bacterium]|nr:hypothetical protein [Clostridiales bacterium]
MIWSIALSRAPLLIAPSMMFFSHSGTSSAFFPEMESAMVAVKVAKA